MSNFDWLEFVLGNKLIYLLAEDAGENQWSAIFCAVENVLPEHVDSRAENVCTD